MESIHTPPEIEDRRLTSTPESDILMETIPAQLHIAAWPLHTHATHTQSTPILRFSFQFFWEEVVALLQDYAKIKFFIFSLQNHHFVLCLSKIFQIASKTVISFDFFNFQSLWCFSRAQESRARCEFSAIEL